jgi:hypothetical protein
MRWLAVIVVVAACSSSFSSYQTARLLAPGRQRVTAAVGGGLGFGDQIDPAAAFEGAYRRGVTPSVEVGAKLSHARGDGALDGAVTLGLIDVTWGLLPDELALALPIGLSWSHGPDQVRAVEAQPALIWTATLSPALSVDTALKGVFLWDNQDWANHSLGGAMVVGVRLRSDRHRFELRPELGLMIEDRDGDAATMVGAALAVSWLP